MKPKKVGLKRDERERRELAEADLDDIAECFERWGAILRHARKRALVLGAVKLSWSRKSPKEVPVVIESIKDADGFRVDLGPVLKLHGEIAQRQRRARRKKR